MATTGIIVVATDTVFRRSIVFVLESAGFEAVPYTRIEAAFAWSEIGGARCAIVDEETIENTHGANELFHRFAKPVILLVSSSRAMLDTPVVRYLSKPFLGEPLLDAVRNAVGWIKPDT